MIDLAREDQSSWWLRRTDQACAAAVAIAAVIFLVGNWYFHGGRRGELIEIERTERLPVAYRVNLNQADWPEIAMLPDVGEMLAKRIVESRQVAGPFSRPEDLRRVKGVGPRTFERLRPYVVVDDVER